MRSLQESCSSDERIIEQFTKEFNENGIALQSHFCYEQVAKRILLQSIAKMNMVESIENVE